MTTPEPRQSASVPSVPTGPRVESMHFRITSTAGTTYEVTKASEWSNDYGAFRLGPQGLTWRPAANFETTALAQAAVMPYLRIWEIQSDLDYAVGELRFCYESAELQEPGMGPATPGKPPILMELTSSIVLTARAEAHATRHSYPAAPDPSRLGNSLLVEIAHGRWQRYCAGQESLPAAAYYIYSLVRSAGGGSSKTAAQHFQIDQSVLRHWSTLATLADDASAARKIDRQALAQLVATVPMRPMPDAQRVWLETIVKRTIRRLAEVAAGTELTRISMTDLPPLP